LTDAGLLLQSPADAARWLRTHVSGALHADSRRVLDGDGFVAWPGARVDARRFVGAALAAGAAACLVERAGAAELALPDSDRVVAYEGLKAACGEIASIFYGQPSRALRLVAVTGTNGKTSTAWWLTAALSALAHPELSPCALVGTLGAGPLDALEPTGLTTPDPVLLQSRLADFVREGLRSCALEASSIGLAEQRLVGTHVDVAVFTNFSPDHLDYHHDMAAYWDAKRALFDRPELRAAVVNLDDARGSELAAHARARGVDTWPVSLQGRPGARLSASVLTRNALGALCWRVHEGERVVEMQSSLIAEYNAANVMGVIAALRALHVPLADAVQACAQLPPVPARLEHVAVPGAPLAIVDFAHTPDALQHVLEALKPLARQRQGRLWCLFGCGGNRDASKRPLMAAVAEALADQVVITSDNPRDEDPLAIVLQVKAGLRRPADVRVEPDRAQAIRHVLMHEAGINDVVLIAGKGHETWQEIAGEKWPFSDRSHARAALRARVGTGVQA